MCVREALLSRRAAGGAVRAEAVPTGSLPPRQSPAEVLRAAQTPPGAEALLQEVLDHVGTKLRFFFYCTEAAAPSGFLYSV